MKKTVLMLLAVFVVSVTYGQVEAGKTLLGGTSNFSFTTFSNKMKNDSEELDLGSNSSFEFNPHVGYFVADGVAMGISLPCTIETAKDDDGAKVTSSYFVFAPFIRSYFGSSNVRPFLQIDGGVGSVKNKTNPAYGSGEEETSKVLAWDLIFGLGFFLNEKISMDLSLGYGYLSMEPNENNYQDISLVSSGVAFNVGFAISL